MRVKFVSESPAFQLISVGVVDVIVPGSYSILKPNSVCLALAYSITLPVIFAPAPSIKGVVIVLVKSYAIWFSVS